MRHLLGESYGVTYADPAGKVLVGHSKSGVPCIIEMDPYHTTQGWQESVLVAFERGYIKIDLPAPLAGNEAGKVEIFKDPGNGKIPEYLQPSFPPVHSMLQQAINFISAIRGKAKPPCDAFEALEDLKVAYDYIMMLKNK